MPAKDAVIKKVIEDVIGTSRKGRAKVVKLVQKKHPELGSSKIRRVYVFPKKSMGHQKDSPKLFSVQLP